MPIPDITNLGTDPDMNDAVQQGAAEEVTGAIPAPANPTLAQPAQPTQPAPMGAPMAAPATPQPQPAPHARLFDRILSTIGGGDVNVQMPDGSVRPVPRSRGTLAKSIVAGALAGMFSGGSSEVPSGFGNAPKISPELALSQGFQGGKQFREEMDKDAQRKVDETQARKMLNFSNNAKVMQQMIALAAQGHQNLDPVVQNNKQGIISAAEQYDSNRPAGEPSVFLERGLQAHDAMSLYDSKGGKHMLTDSNVVLEGVTDVRNPQTGVMEPHPLYAVLRPDAKLKLTEDQTKALGRFFPQMDTAWSATGGNVNMTAAKYNAANLKVNSLLHMEGMLKSLAEDMGVEAPDFAAEFRKNPTAMMQAVEHVEQALAQKHDGSQPDQILSAMQSAPNGDMLTKMLGTPGEVGQFIEDQKTDRLKEESRAKAAGLLAGGGIKNPAQANSILASPNTSEDEKALASDWLVRNATTQAGLAGIKATAAQKAKMKTVLEDPETTTLAQNIVKGDGYGKMNDFVSRGQGEKKALSIALSAAATAHDLDPAEFSPAALDSKATMYKDYTSGKTRQNLNSFGIFSAHASDAIDAINRIKQKGLSIRGIPVMNRPLNEWADKFSGDPDVRALKAALLPPSKEFMSFLNANRAEHDKDLDAMAGLINENTSPDNLLTSFKGLMKSADDRVVGLGDAYIGTMKTTYPELVNPATIAAMRKAGIEPGSERMSVKLPKGNWEYLDPKSPQGLEVARKFRQAAGGDMNRARELAKYSGWSLTPPKPAEQQENPPQAAPQE